MPTFATPEPISVELDVIHADIRLTAGPGTETTVDVAPADDSAGAIQDAQDTEVRFNGRTLEITQPRPKRKLFTDIYRRGGIVLTIVLPTGSTLSGKGGLVTMKAAGQLGEFRMRTGAGLLDLDETGPVFVDSASSQISVRHAMGQVDVNAANGAVWFGTIDGPGAIKSVNGTVGVGEALDSLEIRGVSGNVTIDHARTDLKASTINGSVRVGEVCQGAVVLDTAAGSIDVGIKQGTAAWLDAKAMMGSVRNGLNGSDSKPEGAENTVQLRARTQVGSIDVHRA
ncbi:MAG TPA: DUF4097 family beta strand repeat-containing protein [Pseudonocardiaceae bacterium]|jgi:DUF4097 and DUF4098 domain-containing protein YvlB|nr:DUF4097 family beta strand repeat-containing protein [Pseudonocardiaceae bacterium]